MRMTGMTVRQFVRPFFTPMVYLLLFTRPLLAMNNTCGDVWHMFTLDKLYSGPGSNTASYHYVDSEA